MITLVAVIYRSSNKEYVELDGVFEKLDLVVRTSDAFRVNSLGCQIKCLSRPQTKGIVDWEKI